MIESKFELLTFFKACPSFVAVRSLSVKGTVGTVEKTENKMTNLLEKQRFQLLAFAYSQSLMHHFTGLLRANIMTNSQLAC